ncbi:MAG: phosphoenolpyruvate--protein phosphotransferase [Candidatus Hodarchaeota archaeon]
MRKITGIPASTGIAIGKAFVYTKNSNLKTELSKFQNLPPDKLILLFQKSVKKGIEHLNVIIQKTEEEIGTEEAGIFDAQILMLEDEDFQEAVIELLKKDLPLDKAIWDVTDFYVKKFSEMDNEYFKERASDIKDIGNYLINALIGKQKSSLANLSEEVIIVSEELSPSDTAQMRKNKVLGFATKVGGSTSHVAIIARALSIPAVVGSSKLMDLVSHGTLLVVDGNEGEIIIDPDPQTLEIYQNKREKHIEDQHNLKKFAQIKAKTLDGYEVEIQANVGSLDGVKTALENGADGIGLLRTEFLYLDRKTLPTEEETFTTIKNILKSMGNRPVILRTLDIGGDKFVPSLKLPTESNPFLGYRGSRLVSNLEIRNIILAQIRAALRASIFGKLRIMFPMVTTLNEIKTLRAIVEKAQKELLNEGHTITESIEIGIMVEVPSVAICADIIAPHIDFFSIGTNDLTQYTLAADRTNVAVADLYDHYHPSVLRLIHQVVQAAHTHGKWVGVCGELAGDPIAIPLLIGLGIDELSMNPPAILQVKKAVTETSYSDCLKLIKQILSFNESSEVRSFLADLQSSREKP